MTNKSFPQFVSPVPAEVSIARHSFPTALDYADTVRLPSLSLALARAHHAGVSCGCIARMHCADACVCIMRPRPRPQEKNFFRGNGARIKNFYRETARSAETPKSITGSQWILSID